MKIYDISQEILGCAVFPGDPSPEKQQLCSIGDGDVCNLTAFSMCSHNGTHVDAPYHFINEGKSIDELELSSTVGYAYVSEFEGELTADDAMAILDKARRVNDSAAERILIKGRAVVTEAAARVFAGSGVRLVGNESQTVGPESAPKAVHLELLGADIVLLEGVRLGGVPEGAYLLCAQPLSFRGFDGAPCRAILIEL